MSIPSFLGHCKTVSSFLFVNSQMMMLSVTLENGGTHNMIANISSVDMDIATVISYIFRM